MLKHILSVALINIVTASFLHGQLVLSKADEQKISTLINSYSKARENRDTVLLKNILVTDVDQLVSSGEWRIGMNSSIQGMLNSSASSAGVRTLTIDKIRLINQGSAVVDCRYTIQNSGGTNRVMWSTFIVVAEKGIWKISAIRNMLPSGN